ncbi:NAD(P)/FAD-dependent oxidoreductase, partial [archaeon]
VAALLGRAVQRGGGDASPAAAASLHSPSEEGSHVSGGGAATSRRTSRVRLQPRSSFTRLTHGGGDDVVPAPFRVHVGADLYPADMLFVDVGRVPNVAELNLAAAGVALCKDTHGIAAEATCQSSNRNVFVAGDVGGAPDSSVQLAQWQGYHAARNALLPGSSRATPDSVPRVVFTQPQIASVGMTHAAAVAKYGAERVRLVSKDNESLHAPCIEADMHGFVHLVAHKDGTLLGANIVGARAAELVSEVALALGVKAKLSDVALAPHAFPSHTWSLFQTTCAAAADGFVQHHSVGRLFNALYRGGAASAASASNVLQNVLRRNSGVMATPPPVSAYSSAQPTPTLSSSATATPVASERLSTSLSRIDDIDGKDAL